MPKTLIIPLLQWSGALPLSKIHGCRSQGGDMSSQFLKNINFLSTLLYNICARNNVILLHYIYLIHLKITFEVNQFICERLNLHGGPYK